MHLPWKKVKTTRISRFVNDHLRKSQKRRDVSSFVVETGFPTSLVDLVIKNRDKLKQQSKKKRQRDPAIAGSNPSSPSVTLSPLRAPPNSPQPVPRSPVVQNLSTRSSDGGPDETKPVPETAAAANAKFLVFLRILFVVVLALCTKRLTAGLTISAFLLFFLEHVFKHSPAMWKPFMNITVVGVLRLLRSKEVKPEHGPGGSSHGGEGEIQVVGSGQYLIKHVLDEIQPEDDEMIEEGSSHDMSFGHRGIEFEEAVLTEQQEDSKRKLRKLNLKMKMMKFAQKKSSGAVKELELKRVDENVREDYSVLLSISNRKHEPRSKREDGDGIEGGELTWKHFTICVIVLAGLIWGRVLSVLFALSWILAM